HSGGGNGQNTIGLECNQLSRECSNAIDFAIPPAIHDPSVAARPPEPLESLPERADLRLSVGIGLCAPRQHADPPPTFRLLRPCPERPHRCRAADQREELASPHLLPSIRGLHPTTPW